MKGKKLFYRRAELKKFPEKGILKYPSPPSKPENNNIVLQLAMSLTPMSIMLVVSVVMWLKTGSFPLYMLMFVAMIVLQPINAIYNRNKSKKRYQQEVDAWKEKILQVDSDYDSNNQNCKRLLEQCFQSPAEYYKIALNCESFLWSTMPEHNDFAIARLGVYDGSFLLPELNGSPAVIDDEIREIWEACEKRAKSPVVENTPFIYDFGKKGFLGVCGGDVRYQALAGLITGLSIRHGYDIFHIALITNKDILNTNFEYIKWLPHIWNNDNTRRMIALNEQDLISLYNDITLFYKVQSSRKSKELVLCVVDDTSYMLSSDLYKAAKDKSFSDFLSFVFVEKNKNNLPSICTNILNVENTIKAVYYDQQNLSYDADNNVCGTELHPDMINSDEAEKISRLLASVKIIDGNDKSDIPSSIGFLRSMQISSITHLDILNNWSTNYASDGATALIGCIGKNENIETDFQDGINMHMIVTGTSGSGKSQFLTSMILSMMLKYSPDEVNFVFMDFKGNAFSSLFAYNNKAKELLYPKHIVGSISNIESGGTREITRIRVMLKKEISNREKLLGDATEAGYISEGEIKLYQKAIRDKKIKADALPILIIVIDEFVELIESHKEIIEELNTIARKGRSLGIHLVLSAQKISGKLPAQISANANARICFRVLEVSDSNEMIGKPDAALINPRLFGRGYAKLSGSVKEFQTPWTGMKYEEKSHDSGVYDVDAYGVMALLDETYHNLLRIKENLLVPGENNNSIKELSEALQKLDIEDKDSATLINIKRILSEIYVLIKQSDNNLAKKLKKVCDEIEVRLNVTELQRIIQKLVTQSNYKKKSILTSTLPSMVNNFKLMKECENNNNNYKSILPIIPIGKSDNIYTQSHDIALFDYLKGGWIIRGIESSGKTQFLSTLIYNTCYLSKSPQILNIYICDLQSRELDVFSVFSQVSRTIIDSPEKLIRMIYVLQNIENEREKLFENTYTTWQHYCEREEQIPAIIVVIDNYDYIADNYSYIIDDLLPLMEYGKKFGIFFIISTIGKSQGLISSKYPNYLNKVIFMQPKDTDYSSLLSVSDIKSLERIKGRCFITNSVVLETQIAYLDYEDKESLVKTTSQKIDSETSYSSKYKPVKIEELMSQISLPNLVKRCDKFSQKDRIFIGLDCLSILPFYMDVDTINYFALTSDSLQIRKKFIKSFVTLNLLLGHYKKNDIVIVSADPDFSNMGCKYVDITKFKTNEEIAPIINQLKSSFHIIITDNLTQTAMKLKTLKGVYDLFRDFLYELYSHEVAGFWINSITDSSFKRASDFENWAISTSEFAAQLSQPSNIFIQVAHKNDDLRATPRPIDRASIGKALPINQAWVRENGQYWRIIFAE